MQRALLRLSRIAFLLCVSRIFLPIQLPAQQANTPAGVDDALEGKRIFATSCAACHGLDGHGAERGPDIASKAEIRQLGDQDLSRIIQDGIAGTGMPSFSVLGLDGIQAVIRHLRSLQGQNSPEKLPGDPGRGKDLFFARAGCSHCHMVNGEGGFIASDLSRYAGTLTAKDIRSAIIDPNQNLDPRRRVLAVTTREGKTLTGVARNEDNFSLQMQGTDGAFHMFRKSELRSFEYQPRSLMPADYGSRLSQQEIDDLVGYLMSRGKR